MMIQLISTRILICLSASNSSESDMIRIQNSQSEAAIGYIDPFQSHSHFFHRPHYRN